MTSPWRERTRSVLSGLGVLALVVAGVTLPTMMNFAPPSPEPRPVEVGAGLTTIVCPGSAQVATAFGGEDVSYDLELGTGEDEMVTKVQITPAGPISSVRVGQPGTDRRPTSADTVVDDPDAPMIAEYEPVDGKAPLVAGVTIGFAESGDLRGLVASPCLQPSASAWFVGGNTEISSSAQLVLINPGDTPVRVTMTGWTGLGPMDTHATELLEPDTSTVVLLETIERGERIAVHVSAEGGQVAGYIQTSTLEGLTPAGVAYVEPTTAPSEESIFGPVDLPMFDSVDTATLRVVNPGEVEADISVDLLGADGETPLAGAQGLTIDPGTVSEIPLAASEEGEYAIRVRATAAVAAGVSLTRQATQTDGALDPPRDIAWLAASETGKTLTLPVGVDAMTTLGVANPSAEPAQVEVFAAGRDGELNSISTMTMAPGSSATVDPPSETFVVKLTSTVPVIATGQLHFPAPDGTLIDAIVAGVETPERNLVTVVVTEN